MPPTRYPDLFPVLNVLISATVFGCTWIWSIKRGVELGWALAGSPRPKDREQKSGRSLDSPSMERRSVLNTSTIALGEKNT